MAPGGSFFKEMASSNVCTSVKQCVIFRVGRDTKASSVQADQVLMVSDKYIPEHMDSSSTGKLCSLCQLCIFMEMFEN